jgi:hypothetical protein
LLASFLENKNLSRNVVVFVNRTCSFLENKTVHCICHNKGEKLFQVGGPYWDVPVGRLDSKEASLDLANKDIPTAQQGLVTLISKFWEKGLDATDMVALVGMFILLIKLQFYIGLMEMLLFP